MDPKQIIQDSDPGQSPGSDRIRIHNTALFVTCLPWLCIHWPCRWGSPTCAWWQWRRGWRYGRRWSRWDPRHRWICGRHPCTRCRTQSHRSRRTTAPAKEYQNLFKARQNQNIKFNADPDPAAFKCGCRSGNSFKILEKVTLWRVFLVEKNT